MIEYARSGVSLRVVALSPEPGDRRYFEQLLRSPRAVVPAPPQRAGERPDAGVGRADVPVGLALAVLALTGLLALNELWHGRLTWGRA